MFASTPAFARRSRTAAVEVPMTVLPSWKLKGGLFSVTTCRGAADAAVPRAKRTRVRERVISRSPLERGAGTPNRTGDLPLTRRLLYQTELCRRKCALT